MIREPRRKGVAAYPLSAFIFYLDVPMPVAENVIELHCQNSGGHVRVVPPDRDLMTLPVELAIEACRAFKHQIEFNDQFSMLLDHLAKWMAQHRDRVSQAYLTTRDAGLLFLVIQSSSHYDSDLEDELTNLDLDVANDPDFSRVMLNVLGLPAVDEESIRSFLNPKVILQYKMNGD